MDADKVYILAIDQKAARDWAYRNKPRAMPKVFHPDSRIGPQGLYLSDGTPVFVMDPPSVEVRDAWIMAGARLVHV